jgi:hypothetical protein
MVIEQTVRMPVSVAARKGVSAVAAAAAERRVVLTSLGRPVAVVDSAARTDETARLLREMEREVIDGVAATALAAGPTRPLADVCARLGIDPDAVRARAEALAAGASRGPAA